MADMFLVWSPHFCASRFKPHELYFEVLHTNFLTAWFNHPKHMPQWLYQYFLDTVGPLIFLKKSRTLFPPPTFSNTCPYLPGSLWLHPSEPIMLLYHHKFEPELLYQPRIFLWLAHFFVQTMHYPNCHTGVLEKNRACPPCCVKDCE